MAFEFAGVYQLNKKLTHFYEIKSVVTIKRPRWRDIGLVTVGEITVRVGLLLTGQLPGPVLVSRTKHNTLVRLSEDKNAPKKLTMKPYGALLNTL